MTNHPVTNHELRSDDAYESLARTAGEAMRRPAPHDGLARVDAARRRHQRVRVAAGAVAIVAAVAAGAAVVLHDEPASISTPPDVTTPEPTTPPATSPPATTGPVSTQPPSTTPSNEFVAPPDLVALQSAELAAWRTEHEARGFTNFFIVRATGTTARLVTAIDPSSEPGDNAVSAVLLEDGRLVEQPEGSHSRSFFWLYAVGGLPALLDYGPDGDANPLSVWVLDPATGAWTSTGDLGFGDIDRVSEEPFVTVVGDVMLVTIEEIMVGVDGQPASASSRGVVVKADLSITPMTPSPDGVPTEFTSVAGGRALVFFPTTPIARPWAYDPSTNTWSQISLPDWLECVDPTACEWAMPSDFRKLEVVTDLGVLVGVPDGSIGLYDPITDSWSRLDPPFSLTGMWSATAVGNHVVIGNGEDAETGFGVIGVLDVSTGRSMTTQIEFTSKAMTVVEWGEPYWEFRITGSRVIAAPGGTRYGSTVDPVAVYDTATGGWSDPTADDLAAWALLGTEVPAY
jgi:hypothetical protein